MRLLPTENLSYTAVGVVLGVILGAITLGLFASEEWDWYEIARDLAPAASIVVAAIMGFVAIESKRKADLQSFISDREAAVEGMSVGMLLELEMMIDFSGSLLGLADLAHKSHFGSGDYKSNLQRLTERVRQETKVEYEMAGVKNPKLGWLPKQQKKAILAAVFDFAGLWRAATNFDIFFETGWGQDQRSENFALLEMSSKAGRALASCIEASSLIMKEQLTPELGSETLFFERQVKILADVLGEHAPSHDNLDRDIWVPALRSWASARAALAAAAVEPHQGG